MALQVPLLSDYGVNHIKAKAPRETFCTFSADVFKVICSLKQMKLLGFKSISVAFISSLITSLIHPRELLPHLRGGKL